MKGLLGKCPAYDIIQNIMWEVPNSNTNTNKESLTCKYMIWTGPLRLAAAEEKILGAGKFY